MISLNSIIDSAVLSNLVDEFPTTLYTVRQVVGIDPDDFVKLTVHPTCNSIYLYEKGHKVVRVEYITFQCFSLIYSSITRKNLICSDARFMT